MTLQQELENLTGVFTDPVAEDNGNGTFTHRHFEFGNGRWSIVATVAFDPGMQAKIFQLRFEGPYDILEKEPSLPNTFRGNFHFDQKFITLLTEDPQITQGFGLDACGLEYQIEKEISASGCSFFPSVAACGTDFDIVSLDHFGNIYFGERPEDNNMCTEDKRPKFLNPAAIRQ